VLSTSTLKIYLHFLVYLEIIKFSQSVVIIS
jgi:hypothetical protein